MKTMSVNEILNCDIPQGDYFNCLNELVSIAKHSIKQDIFGSVNEFRLVFSNLYALAQGEYVRKADVTKIIQKDIFNLPGNTFTLAFMEFVRDKINELPTIGTEV